MNLFNSSKNLLRNVLPRKGTRTRPNLSAAIPPANVKKCITPRGDENLLKHVNIGNNEIFVKKCITPRGDENCFVYVQNVKYGNC